MNICINDKPADITLDTEKTLGDVLSGIELWISPSGNRIQGISVNGQALGEDTLPASFNRDIKDIKKLDIVVSSYRELAAEALGSLYEICILYGNAAFDDRPQIAETWEKSAAARFLRTDISDIYELAGRSFSGEGFSAQDLSIFIRERLREIADPGQEICGCEALVKGIAERMEELPLDIQTGKDQRAAETIQHFSRTGEKLFRIFFILKSEGLSLDTFVIDGLPARTFMEELKAALSELSAAYENRDTVLVGDLSEYELAPRLLKFFFALKNYSELLQPTESAP